MNARLEQLFEPLGNWNPQLLRELKGRWKLRNVAIAIAISLVGQVLLVLSLAGGLPSTEHTYEGSYTNNYCTGPVNNVYDYADPLCILDRTTHPAHYLVNWPLWWLDVFKGLSIAGIFVLLVGGVYLLVSDLDRETRRDTLNFIRLSPRSASSVLVGKLLGVPLLLYLVALLAVPLHLWSAQLGGVSGSGVLILDGVVLLGCATFYSLALLFGLSSTGLGGFQSWLLSGSVFLFLMVTLLEGGITTSAFHWLSLLNPMMVLPPVLPNVAQMTPEQLRDFLPYGLATSLEAQFLHQSLGTNCLLLVGLMVGNYALWSFWIWQSLNRCFHNPGATLFSKPQSYGFTLFWSLMSLGFSLRKMPPYWQKTFEPDYLQHWQFSNLKNFLVLNLLLCLILIVVLLPQRQALLDWARYRRMTTRSRLAALRSLWTDLLWRDRSPALAAFVANLLILLLVGLAWIAFWPSLINKIEAVAYIAAHVGMMVLYAAIAQLILLQRLPRRALWAMGAVATAILLPPLSLSVIGLYPPDMPLPWLFTAFSWAGVEVLETTTVFLGFLAELSAFALISWRFSQQLRRLGESEFKAIAGK